eukprot:s4446_g2.t3
MKRALSELGQRGGRASFQEKCCFRCYCFLIVLVMVTSGLFIAIGAMKDLTVEGDGTESSLQTENFAVITRTQDLSVMRHGWISTRHRSCQKAWTWAREPLCEAEAVQLLGSDSSVPTKAAASAIRNLAANHNAAQLAIAKAGAITPLINLLTHSDQGVQAQAAAALGNLAGDSSENHFDKQMMIAQAGAVPPLVQLLERASPELREAGASALRMLATNNADNQVAVAHAGAIRPLVRLLYDEMASVREEAAAALGNLVFYNDETNAGNQAAIAEAGALPRLGALLQDKAAAVAETAAGALRNLAAQNAANQDSVCQSDALRSLVGLLKESREPKAQVEAAGAIHNLAAGNTRCQGKIVEAGGLQPLVSLLKEEAPRMREVAAGALWALARDNPELQKAIDRSGNIYAEHLPQRHPKIECSL